MPSLPAAVRADFERFIAGPPALRAAVADLDAGTLNRRPPGSDWSIRDVLMHLVDTEVVIATQARQVVANTDAETPPVLPECDAEPWKRRLHYLWRDPEAALVTFQMVRFTTAELLQQCDAATFQRTGVRNGVTVTLASILSAAVDHTDGQLARIHAFRNPA